MNKKEYCSLTYKKIKLLIKKYNNRIHTCWYCKMTGKNLLDKFGCCIGCETNLIRYPIFKETEHPVFENIDDDDDELNIGDPNEDYNIDDEKEE